MSPTTTRRSGREPSSFVTVSAVLLGARGRPSKRPTVSLNERERVAHWRTAVGGDTALPSTAIGADDDLPSPPGSPVRLPGGWISKGKGRAAEATEDGLALPPPFLDESSTPESFESASSRAGTICTGAHLPLVLSPPHRTDLPRPTWRQTATRGCGEATADPAAARPRSATVRCLPCTAAAHCVQAGLDFVAARIADAVATIAAGPAGVAERAEHARA